MSNALAKTKHGAEVIRNQVLADIRDFSTPVKIERLAWAKWLSEQFLARGMDAMAAEVSHGNLYPHARALASEVLWSMGGFETPHLCHPVFLSTDSPEFAAYWRAIAIAANATG